MPSSTVCSSPGKFRSKDHEMRFETSTGQPVIENLQKDLIQGDTMTNSQVRHFDARLKASTVSPMAWGLSRTKNSQASTGHPVIKNSKASTGLPVIKNLVTDTDLEAIEECNILSAASISFRERVNERLRAILNRFPGDVMEGIDKHFLTWGMFTTSSMRAAIFLGQDYSENLHAVRNTGRKPTAQKRRKSMYSQPLYCALENE